MSDYVRTPLDRLGGGHVRAGRDVQLHLRHPDARARAACRRRCRSFAAGLLVSAPMAGLLLTLIAWGAAADRIGERVVIVAESGPRRCCCVGAASCRGTTGLAIALALAGAAGASVNAASGRMVMGWFPPRERGLAMGTRQTAQPLGVAVAALGAAVARARVRCAPRAAVPGRAVSRGRALVLC